MSALFKADTKSGVSQNLLESAIIALVLTALSYGVGLHFGWVTSLNWLEVFAVATSYSCTYLCVVERRLNYPIGAISNAAYCVLFASFGLVGSSFLTGYLTLSLVYGWFRWKSDAVSIPVTHVALKWVPVYVLFGVISFGVALLLYPAFGQPVIWTDAVILVASVIAQLLLDNKKIETWAVWAVVNVFAIYTYFVTGLPLVGFQYVFFLANTLYGWYMWNKSMSDEVEELPLPEKALV